MNLENICMDVIALAKSTGIYIMSERENEEEINIKTKELHNFVTHVDETAERMLVNGLLKIIPESGFIAEEGTNDTKGKVFNWIIDPLDGTTNFIHGLSPFAISIALMEGDNIILGVIYEISLDECFWAYSGSKAFLNGNEIKVSNIDTVNGSLIATGFPYYDYERIDAFFKTMDHFMKNSHGLRRLGSAATDLAYVACGRFEAFYEYSLQPWDVAAGAFIVQQAGGRVSDFSGEKNYIFGKEIIATNSRVFDEFQRVIKNYMTNKD